MGFPFRIDPATGGVAWSSGKDKIRQNVSLILGTRFGERPMLRDFGTRIPSLVHDPNDDVLATAVQEQVLAALLRFESRVLGTNVTTARQDGELTVRVNYIYVEEGMSDTLVLPLENPR
ncbi:MAG: GPW/gp25 family protein [Acidobacteria bacterium]|nr:GPW/gp25 family protein [Acidobacteriota bacterium]